MTALNESYVRVAVNVPRVRGEFDYSVPEEIYEQVQPGCLVVVPFGDQKVQGIVLETNKSPSS